MAPAAPVELTGDWVVDENYQPVDMAQLTADQIIGADVRNAGRRGGRDRSSDLILGADGKAESVAAKFGGFLGFGSNTVLLNLDEVEFMQNDAGTGGAAHRASRPSRSRAVPPTKADACHSPRPLRDRRALHGGPFRAARAPSMVRPAEAQT